MENATKAIIIAASVVITLAIVTIGFFILRSGQSTATNAVNDMADKMNSVAESEYTMYDGMVVTGSEVLSAIEKVENSGDAIGVSVKTGTSTATEHWYVYVASSPDALTTTGTTDIDDAKDVTKTDTYINPAGRFAGEVSRDRNGRIACITFEQQ